MNIFRMHRNYRKIGPGYGLPVFYIDIGFGMSLPIEEILIRLSKLGAYTGATVVFRRSPLKEKGIGVLVEGLKSIGLKVEVEENGEHRDPVWFPKVDRWIVDWKEKNEFNYGALRPRQDLLLCRDGNLDGFIRGTEKMMCLKGAISNNPDEIWDTVKGSDIRVYQEEI